MKLEKLKNVFLKILIGCLIAAAALAVVTILIGNFNTLCARALWTIILVAVHSLLSLTFINNNQRQQTFDSLSLFTNAAFVLLIFSFVTSLGGVWGILPGTIVGKLYGAYFVLLFAVLHAEVLAKTLHKQSYIDKVVVANYVLMCVVVLMLLVLIFAPSLDAFNGFYYRLLAACGIVDATLSLIAIILHRVYVQKHPAIKDAVFNAPQATGQPATPVSTATAPPHRGINIFVGILIAYIVLQLVVGLGLLVLGRLLTW